MLVTSVDPKALQGKIPSSRFKKIWKQLQKSLWTGIGIGLTLNACQQEKQISSSSESLSSTPVSVAQQELPKITDPQALAQDFVQALVQKDLDHAEKRIIPLKTQAIWLQKTEAHNYPDSNAAQMMAQMFALENQKALLRWGAVLEQHKITRISIGDSTQKFGPQTTLYWPVKIELQKPDQRQIQPKIVGGILCDTETGCFVWTLADTHSQEY
jgi:hypothetical protein